MPSTIGTRSTGFLSALSALLLVAGCWYPYSIGNTAQTLRPGETSFIPITYVVPSHLVDNADRGFLPAMDVEYRFGMDEKSDFGIRVQMLQGVSTSYKRRLAGSWHPDSAALSFMVGTGVALGTESMTYDIALLASGRKRNAVIPYAGLRYFKSLPVSSPPKTLPPDLDATIGARVGTARISILPEIGIFVDTRARHGGARRLIIVPAITLAGDWWSAR